MSATPLVAVTDHAAERYRQRVRGTLDARTEVASRVARAWAAGAHEPGARRGEAAAGGEGEARDSGTLRVRDLERADLVYVCRMDARGGELVVVTLWEEGEEAAVPRRFTDALRERRRRMPD